MRASILPLMLVGMALMGAVGVYTTIQLARAPSRTSLAPPVSSEGQSFRCGFRLERPVFTVSYPVGKLVVDHRHITMTAPLFGSVVFVREHPVAVEHLEQRGLFQRLRVSDSEKSAVVYLRDRAAVAAAMSDLGWDLTV